MPLEWLFGKRMTPEELLRRNQRALNKAMRDLDRERARMEQQEKKIITDIKKMAKEGQMVCRHNIYEVIHRRQKSHCLQYVFTVVKDDRFLYPPWFMILFWIEIETCN
jgi:hypothetical protein